jgi:hypothetical protein
MLKGVNGGRHTRFDPAQGRESVETLGRAPGEASVQARDIAWGHLVLRRSAARPGVRREPAGTEPA